MYNADNELADYAEVSDKNSLKMLWKFARTFLNTKTPYTSAIVRCFYFD